MWASDYPTTLHKLYMAQKHAIHIINHVKWHNHTSTLFTKHNQLHIFDVNNCKQHVLCINTLLLNFPLALILFLQQMYKFMTMTHALNIIFMLLCIVLQGSHSLSEYKDLLFGFYWSLHQNQQVLTHLEIHYLLYLY